MTHSKKTLPVAVWRIEGVGDGGESKLGYQLEAIAIIQARDGRRAAGEVEKLSDSDYSLKVVPTASADGLELKCQRKKETRMILQQLEKCSCLELSSLRTLREEKEVYWRGQVQFLVH